MIDFTEHFKLASIRQNQDAAEKFSHRGLQLGTKSTTRWGCAGGSRGDDSGDVGFRRSNDGDVGTVTTTTGGVTMRRN